MTGMNQAHGDASDARVWGRSNRRPEGRSTVFAPRGAVATSHPLATGEGLRVLQEGGTAVDAAVTAAAVLAVVEPHMTGLGGDAFALLWSGHENELVGLDGHGRSGELMTRERLEARGAASVPEEGAEPVTVPGGVRAWADLLERYGTIPFSRALAPAARLARDGFPLSPVVASEWAERTELLRGDSEARRIYLDADGGPLEAGTWITNPDLADALERLRSRGPDELYRGELAQRIVEVVADRGGFLTLDDMAAHRSRWVSPISAPFRGFRVWQLPPPGQGVAVLQMLRILETFPLDEMGVGTPEYLHHLIEAKKLAYADLERYVGDPTFMGVTVEDLLAEGYVAHRRNALDPKAAAEAPAAGSLPDRGDTVYLAAADESGNMVSFIHSIFHPFGSGLVVPGAGFHLQNRGAAFTMEPGTANTVAPGKEPFHTIIPGFVTREEGSGSGGREPWLAFGVMGGPMQPQGQVQLLLNLVLGGMDLQEAVEAPRFRHDHGREVTIEPPLVQEVGPSLARLGHRVAPAPPGTVGGAQAVSRLERGWAAASESRKDGQAAGC